MRFDTTISSGREINSNAVIGELVYSTDNGFTLDNAIDIAVMKTAMTYPQIYIKKVSAVAAMSFQGANAFYEKLGYVVDFERPGYTRNSSCIFLKRSL